MGPDASRKSRLGIRAGLFVASVFGIGYIPVAPGTFGSAAGLVVWALVPHTGIAQGLAILALLAIGSWAGSIAEHHFGRVDPRQVVIDEVMGMMITLFKNPVGWRGALGAFLIFRIFDVIKPFPANRLEKLPGGLGVMADDGMAAVYSNLALRGILAFGNWIIS